MSVGRSGCQRGDQDAQDSPPKIPQQKNTQKSVELPCLALSESSRLNRTTPKETMSENEYHNSTAFFARHDGESMHRLLASAENEKTVDYAIFSVFVITLTLVLVVEVMRRSVSCFLHFFLLVLYLPILVDCVTEISNLCIAFKARRGSVWACIFSDSTGVDLPRGNDSGNCVSFFF